MVNFKGTSYKVIYSKWIIQQGHDQTASIAMILEFLGL